MTLGLVVSSKKYIYADGGEDGEFVTRGVVAGLPKMLNPGGQFVGAIRATDRKDGLIEERMRQWMGDAQSEFDIAPPLRSDGTKRHQDLATCGGQELQ